MVDVNRVESTVGSGTQGADCPRTNLTHTTNVQNKTTTRPDTTASRLHATRATERSEGARTSEARQR